MAETSHDPTAHQSADAPHSTAALDTARYYEEHAAHYAELTRTAQTGVILDRFMAQLPQPARILDVGCGSGRDLRAFVSRGHSAIGIDASASLIQLAREHSGAECRVLRVEDMDYSEDFDGIWACASLLHLRRDLFMPALALIRRALKPGGKLFLAMQEGHGEQILPDGRLYVYYSEEVLRDALEMACFSVGEIWMTEASATVQHHPRWINVMSTAQ